MINLVSRRPGDAPKAEVPLTPRLFWEGASGASAFQKGALERFPQVTRGHL